MTDAFDVMMEALDRTEAAIELSQFERTIDEWGNGQISLEDAHDALVRLGHSVEESFSILRAHDMERFDRVRQPCMA
jgi:hypothetical protein